MFTQCPSCKTVFNVKPEQLNAANGKVRCSRCQTIFNARENRYTPQDTRTAADKAALEKTGAPVKPREKQPEVKPAAKKAPPANTQQAVPAAHTPRTEQPAPAEPKTEEWFDLSPTPAARPDTGKDTPAKISGEKATTSQPPSIEDELNDDLFKLFAEPEIAPPAPSSVIEPTSRKKAETGGSTDATASSENRKRANDVTGGTTETASAAPATSPAPEKEHEEEARTSAGGYSLPPQLESRPVRATMRTLFYVLSNLMLVAALVVQYAYNNRIPLQENESIRPWLDSLCQITDCPMPPKRDLNKIELVDNMMQSHPRYRDSLLVTATLINRADYVQPYPVVEITMSDLQQKVVARRMFRPEEYLAGDIAEMGFTPNVEVALMLELADPGDNAVGFKFDFY